MNAILNLGKYLFAIPFAVFGIFHFMGAKDMAPMAFGQEILVYVTGAALIAATISMLLGKLDKLASILLGIMMLSFVVLVHLPGAMEGNQSSMMGMLKDIMLAGGAFMYAKHAASDASIIG